MKMQRFEFSNHLPEDVRWCLEPEGSIHLVPSGATIEIALSADNAIAVDIQVRTDASGLYFAIWPVEGDYEIKGLWKG
jgi:hypothetical protein